MQDNGRVIALLIDAENVSPKYIEIILNELSTYGTTSYKRIYGDWTSTDMGSWKKVLQQHNLMPMQQFSYTQGKNSSDSAMIIDAMDILYTGNCDGFCLVSSDSDFTRLASRLRESGMYVIGMGESKTPVAFRSACDTFKFVDVLYNNANALARSESPRPVVKPVKKTAKDAAKPAAKDTKADKPKDTAKEPAKPAVAEPVAVEPPDEAAGGFIPLEDIVARIREIVDKEGDEDGNMMLSQVGNILGRQYPDFDTRNYGFSKLHKLIDYTGAFDTQYINVPGGGKNLMIRNK